MRLRLGAWWPEGRSSSSVSQFLPTRFWSACPMAVRWKDGFRGDLSPWLLQRGEGRTQRCAQLRARLSAELCSPVLWRYYTTLRCTESIHFLWPLNRKFSGLLVRPWISSAVADGTVFAWLSWLVFECVQSKSGPRRCLHRGTWSCSPSPQGPADHKRSVGQQVSLFWSLTISSLVCSRSERDSCPGTMMLVSLPHPSMRSHHCWKWGPEPQYHQQI